MNRKNILKLMLVLQIILCIFTPMEVYLGAFVPYLMVIMFVSLAFWLQLEPSIKHKELMEQVAEANYEFIMRIAKLKMGDSEKAGKQRLKISVVAGLVFVGIALLVYIISYLNFLSRNFLWIINHFLKITRIIGFIIFIGSACLLIRHIYLIKHGKERIVTEITMVGLVIENILFSMMLFIF